MSDNEFLDKKRIESEVNLIKTAILTKLHYKIPLTESQKTYHAKWKESLKQSFKETLTPKTHSNLVTNNLTTEDIYQFGTIHNVDLSSIHDYAVNDIVLDLMTIIDPSSIEKIEKQIYVNNMKLDWGISKNFVAERVRNKEAEVMMG